MKALLAAAGLLLGLNALAHEGHGEMPTEAAKYGGQLSNVVDDLKMEKKAKHNPPLYKAELVRSEDGTLRVYLYDTGMKQIGTGDFGPEAEGTVDNPKEKTKAKISLKSSGDHYLGKMPKQKKRPFNVYVRFSRGNQKLFAGFDNLD